MNSREFFDAVAKMREAQKSYFRTRTKSDLSKSKALESVIDREIERVLSIPGVAPIPPEPKQTNLFD